ncbi:MAG: hypothetical protein IT359_10705 [Gemmatimonadaceae bacterium]|nr:hypothetical protein [Gemmatimonadaceae bacterium]
MFMLILQVLMMNLSIFGGLYPLKGPTLIDGLGRGSSFLLTVIGVWVLAWWTRSFKWLAVPLLVGLLALGNRFATIAPKHGYPFPEPAFLLGLGVWSAVAVLLLMCVTRKRIAS